MIAPLKAIIWRELLRFFHQRARFFAALVRPLVWLFIFGAGFRAALGLSIMPPYQTYIQYEVYIVPGLCAMILLFNGMQSSLAMVYDREMGTMRLLLTAPLPRSFVLFAKLCAGAIIGSTQCYVFLLIAWIYGIKLPPVGYVVALPAILLSGLMLGALGLLVSALIKQLQNFASVMNFIIFPMFFLSTALYPIWRLQESAPILAKLAQVNPFTHCAELIRFAFYVKFSGLSFAVVVFSAVGFFLLAARSFDPRRRQWQKTRTSLWRSF